MNPSITSSIDNLVPVLSDQPIEDKIKSLYSQYTVEVQNKKNILINQAENLDVSNPMEVMKIQHLIGQYSLELNFISTITHKLTGTLDTLLKAQ